MIGNQDHYTIKIKQFEGPFDLLLFFIERDEIDILDIPVAKITKDFLDYIHTLEELNLDVASEFILVAATLMRIKAKMLLPRPQIDDQGEVIDPRQELAQKLIEYKRFKEVTADFLSLEEHRRQITSRGNRSLELKKIATHALVDVELESLTLYKLFKSFEEVMKRLDVRQRGPHQVIYKYNYSIEGQKSYVLDKLKKGVKTSFTDLFEGLRDRLHAIITFLSILEMINTQEIKIITVPATNSFWIEKVS